MSERQPNVIASILAAYRQGYFPMAEPARRRGREQRIMWYSPDPRAILPLEIESDERGSGSESPAAGPVFHVPRSLRRRIRQRRFEITSDAAFGAVIRRCAEPRRQEPESWIDDRIVRAYTMLHEAGWAHSVEAWVRVDSEETGEEPGEGPKGEPSSEARAATGVGAGPRALVGGIYGVHIGSAFFAESMFSRPEIGGTDASKVCLVHLVHHLRRRGFTLLDVQMSNPHTERFGVIEIPRNEYLRRLEEAVEKEAAWMPFEPEKTVEDPA